MPTIELFHGSANVVEQPVFGAGNAKNDYGLGFYCTKHLELACEWAVSGVSDGFANMYRLDTRGLKVMKLNSADYHILNWLAILLENRTYDISGQLQREARQYLLDNFLPDYKNYDIITGYRADDSYFSFSKAFLSNSISLEQLRRAMKLGKLGEQIVLKSQSAFNAISFVEALPVSGDDFFPLRAARDRDARNAFTNMQSEGPVTDAVYLIDIMRQKWNNDDTRLR